MTISALSLAAAQTVPRRGDVPANLEQHLRLARRAAEEGARVVVFPELSLTGYELDLAGELAFSVDDERLRPLREEACRLSLSLVVGVPLRLGANLHIGALILLPDGSLETYTKHHLGAFSAAVHPGGAVPPPEASVFEPGDRNPLLPVGKASAAIAVCADTGKASHPENAARRGARVYLASMFVIPADLEQEAANLRSCAARHGMTVVLANYGAPSGGLPSAGQSAIWSDRGDLLGRLGPTGQGIVVATRGRNGWRGRAIPIP